MGLFYVERERLFMLHYKNGDLLKSDCTVVMHQANCRSTMGSGIAASIAKKYPGAKIVDENSLYDPDEKFGSYTAYKDDNGVTIVNLYGQYNFGREVLQTNYDKLESAIDMFFHAVNSGIYNKSSLKIGVPYKMGCDRAGGDWSVVSDILDRQSKKHQLDIYIYKL